MRRIRDLSKKDTGQWAGDFPTTADFPTFTYSGTTAPVQTYNLSALTASSGTEEVNLGG